MRETEHRTEVAQKDRAVVDLYALRAVLSLISREADDARIMKTNADEKANELPSKLRRIDEEIKKAADSLEFASDTVTPMYDKHYVRKETWKAFRSSNAKNSFFRSIGLISILLVATILTALLDFNKAVLPLAILFTAALFLSGSIIGVYFVKNYRLIKTETEELIAKKTFIIQTAKERIESLKVVKRNLLNAKEHPSVEIADDFDKIIAFAGSIYRALENRVDIPLASVDWASLDECIYYLQTKRADNIKECLARIDDENKYAKDKNDARISKLVSDEISSEIKRSPTTTVTCKDLLSEKLEQLSEQLLNSLSDDENIEYIQNLLTAENLTDALKAKADIGCAELLLDCEYINTVA